MMWDSLPVDQADAYGRDLSSRAMLTEVEKFHPLRVNFNAKFSKDEWQRSVEFL
jgi:hypothetical protein